jgi:hypothetical protein
MLAAYATGGSVSEVSIFSLRPHVRLEGIPTAAQEAFRTVGGTGLSLLAYCCFMLLVKHRGSTLSLVRTIASWFMCAELLGWILSSLAASSGQEANDASRFVAVSGLSPYAVAAVCAAAGLLCAALNFSQRET